MNIDWLIDWLVRTKIELPLKYSSVLVTIKYYWKYTHFTKKNRHVIYVLISILEKQPHVLLATFLYTKMIGFVLIQARRGLPTIAVF